MHPFVCIRPASIHDRVCIISPRRPFVNESPRPAQPNGMPNADQDAPRVCQQSKLHPLIWVNRPHVAQGDQRVQRIAKTHCVANFPEVNRPYPAALSPFTKRKLVWRQPYHTLPKQHAAQNAMNRLAAESESAKISAARGARDTAPFEHARALSSSAMGDTSFVHAGGMGA